MRFDDRFLDDIRARLNISDVVGRRVTWDQKKSQPSRGDYWACCPFHNEKSPSFHADDRRSRYHCFGCGASGDIFRFTTETQGISFPEAVERLAGEAGIALPERDPEAEKRAQKRGTLYDVMTLAEQFFLESLQTAAGAQARNYVRDRGISPGIQEEFGVGFAPDSRNALKQYLAGKGVPQEDMIEAGLLIAGPDIAVSYDRFRNRVMFPISDARGRIIAFGGRALSADVPAKYLNSPETSLFSKGHILYNHHRAREPVHHGAPLIAVEGYMDVIACASFGLEGAVAPLGTALTEDQMQLLWRMNDSPVLCFDGDAAGFKAAGRAADLALAHLKPGKTIRFALLPDGQDPDDLLRAAGVDAMQTIIRMAKPLSDMVWSRETENRIVDTPEKRAELEERIRFLARSIPNDTIRRHYEQEFRDRLSAYFGHSQGQNQGKNKGRQYGSQKGSFSGKFGSKGFGGRGKRSGLSVSRSLAQSPLVSSLSIGPASTKISPRNAVLLMTLINHPILLDRHDETFSALQFEQGEINRLHQKLIGLFADDPEQTSASLRAGLGRAGFEDLLARLDGTLAACRLWQANAAADPIDAEEGWTQALALYDRAAVLKQELRLVERACVEHESEENFERLVEVKQAIANDDNTQAMIEGFGALSGQ
ncbi:MAG: DNA primase [Hyphomicrobiales bacterium]|nr:DNA primase [Hyphomicrobiales bacterium]PCJ95179.1 MAG: DNA primase [Hyphomicrobiales bacterium]